MSQLTPHFERQEMSNFDKIFASVSYLTDLEFVKKCVELKVEPKDLLPLLLEKKLVKLLSYVESERPRCLISHKFNSLFR